MQPDPEILAKHFAEAPNLTIQPGKVQSVTLPTAVQLRGLIETYWTTRKPTYYNTFQNGKLLANSKEYKSPVDIVPVLAALIIQGIKNANVRGGLSNETLALYYNTFKLTTEILETNIKYLIEQKKEDSSADQSQQNFDGTELLAILCGFLVAKLND